MLVSFRLREKLDHIDDCETDLGLISFHVSISLSADLTLWGPDSFGGTAYVDFWFFGEYNQNSVRGE
jgi:hypothetical protein